MVSHLKLDTERSDMLTRKIVTSGLFLVAGILHARTSAADDAKTRDGTIVQTGTLSELRANPADPWVKEFLG